MTKPATIHDIAREAGVSASTVSRVLNGTVPVAENKRAAVLDVINRWNYRPNVVAQGLARGRAGVIGVLTQAMFSPFYGEIYQGIEQGLHGSAFHPMFASGNWRTAEETTALDLLLQRQADGLIVLWGTLPDQQLQQVAGQRPLIAIGRSIAGFERQCLRVDDVQGGYQATRHLIDLGHRRIAHITGLLAQQDARDRREGYLRALADAGLPAEPQLVVEGDFAEQSGLLAMQALLARAARFTAIFVANDQMAYGARLALYRYGIRVPDDISIIGFDDQVGSAYTTPPLTTVRQPTQAMGRAAAQAIVRMLNDEPLDLPTFATELIIRESTALYRN
ncbi:MAG TPA: substrate-binding domain-containing protein [Kouleothrix sp.]|uniref:LacI family DNA-binding transcriptional regulator n=1 Tax=Kouleothrix sp. TaxID=2779161 RepID=UPI002C37A4FE|nr:substrate-binding domain-containing protein [Kouleothrix sp.]